MAIGIGRRHFISALGVAAVTWPLAARAQQKEQMRRIGVLVGSADNPQGQSRVNAFRQALQSLGWADERNVRIDIRWGAAKLLHDRMPVILADSDWSKWLGEEAATDDELLGLLKPCPDEALKIWPVGKAVGNVKNTGPQLAMPLAV